LTNRLLLYDGLQMVFNEFAVNRNPDCDHCGPQVMKMSR
jgi:hypothetical protein